MGAQYITLVVNSSTATNVVWAYLFWLNSLTFPNLQTDFFFFLVSCPVGELRTAAVMDREVTPTYKLIAQATDGGGLFCRSDISLQVLDVNDNAPSFSSAHYLASVFENTNPKALLTRLRASDPDEGKALYDAGYFSGYSCSPALLCMSPLGWPQSSILYIQARRHAEV